MRAQRELDTYAEKNDVSLDAYPEALVQLYARNPDARDFVRDYPKKKDLTPTIDLSGLAGSETVPLLLQWDERWGYREYNESNHRSWPAAEQDVPVHGHDLPHR